MVHEKNAWKFGLKKKYVKVYENQSNKYLNDPPY